jgi:6-pyruvoyltetrahydropterin/6-carboxytetrahydropterin synthase
MPMRVSVFRKAHFNAGHRIFNPAWDDDKNLEVFGKCSNPHYHGHNYELEVKLTGEIDPETGFLIDLKKLRDIIAEHVLEKYDHKNLNIQVPPFDKVIPSTENICIEIYRILRKVLDEKYEIKIRLYESPRNYVEFPVE